MVGVWVARYLGKENNGILAYGLSFYSMFTLFVNLGMNPILQREFVKRPELEYRLVGTAFWIKLFGATIAIVLINVIAYFSNFSSLQFLIITILSFQSLFVATNVINVLFKAKVKSKYQVLSVSLAVIFISLIKLLLIYYEAGLEYFAASVVLQMAVASVLAIIFYTKYFGNISKWKFDLVIAKELLKDSWVIGLTGFLSMAHQRIDVLMIKAILNDGEVGLYQVSNVLTTSSQGMIGVLIGSLLPYFVMMKSKDEKLYKRRFQQLLSFSTWTGIIVGLIALFFGQAIIDWAYGLEYSESYSAFVINVWSIIFTLQMSLVTNWLVNLNLQKYQLYHNLLALSVNVILNIILIPKYGIVGAAASTIFTKMSIVWVSPMFYSSIRETSIMSMKSLNPYLLYRFINDYYKMKFKRS